MWKSLTVLTLAAVLLGGCSMVTSETPMFSAADAVGSPELRDGLWGGEDCRPAEVRKAVRRWKACDWVLKRGGEWLSLDEEAWEATPFMIANGAPLVAQLQDKPLAYLYYGLEPLEQDARGGVIRARIWPVLCTDKDPAAKSETFPNLTMREDGGCTPSGPQAVRDAARSSRGALPEKPDGDQIVHWLRDVRPDDFAPQR
jgi:hypothetical protein